MKKSIILMAASALMLLCACEKQDPAGTDPQDMTQDGSLALKSGAPIIETPLELTGISRFYAYSVIEDRFIKSPDEGGPDVSAVLTHKQGHDYLLVTTETVPMLPFPYRIMHIDMKITPGGVVMFSWPDEWVQLQMPDADIVEQVKFDMGYEITGSGINKGTVNFKGTFDGERLVALSHFMGKQVQPGNFAPWFTEIVDGPIKVEFLFDLTVDD